MGLLCSSSPLLQVSGVCPKSCWRLGFNRAFAAVAGGLLAVSSVVLELLVAPRRALGFLFSSASGADGAAGGRSGC